MKNYRSAQEIMNIYSISDSTLETILRKHKIDKYKGKKWILINAKDFHKVYTTIYNPSLFWFEEKKKTKKVVNKSTISNLIPRFWDIWSLFTCIFSKGYK